MRAFRTRLLIITLVVALTASLVGCSANPPSPQSTPKAGAPSHHLDVGFRNPELTSFQGDPGFNRFFWLRRWFGALFEPIPVVYLPRIGNDGKLLRENGHEATVTWVGHSTLLIQVDGVNILTDPQWNGRASPIGFAGPKRFTEPGVRFEDLPPIDMVVISHDHYDHLDESTVLRLAETHRPKFFVPLKVKEWFTDRGVNDVVELDWWEAGSFKHVTVTCVPAQHFSGRTPWDRNRTLWAGWVITSRAKRFYFAGDTGYFEGLKEIGRRLGPFQLAAIPIGPYWADRPWNPNHANPEEALQVFLDVKGGRFVPIHWGTFYMPEAKDEPLKRVEAEARRLTISPDDLFLLKHGEMRNW